MVGRITLNPYSPHIELFGAILPMKAPVPLNYRELKKSEK
jgi:hypothetical protein